MRNKLLKWLAAGLLIAPIAFRVWRADASGVIGGGLEPLSNTTVIINVTPGFTSAVNTNTDAGLVSSNGDQLIVGTNQTGGTAGTCPNCVTNIEGIGNMNVYTNGGLLIVDTRFATNGYRIQSIDTGSNFVLGVSNGTVVLIPQ